MLAPIMTRNTRGIVAMASLYTAISTAATQIGANTQYTGYGMALP